MYFNYHAKAKKLIKSGDLLKYEIVVKYKRISPAMVLFFKSDRPMPIREYRWREYFDLIEDLGFSNKNISIKEHKNVDNQKP